MHAAAPRGDFSVKRRPRLVCGARLWGDYALSPPLTGKGALEGCLRLRRLPITRVDASARRLGEG